MIAKLKELGSIAREAASEWVEDGAPSMGAALAFYSLLSLAPLLVLVIAIAGLAIGREEAQQLLFTQLNGLLGEAGAQGIKAVLDAADNEKEGWMAAAVGFVVLVLGATTVFAELKTDLDRIWDFKAKKVNGILKFLRARLLSFGVVIAVGFLLLVSLAVSGFIAAIGAYFTGGIVSQALLHLVEFIGSFVIITGLFALIYKLLPSIRIEWGDVWVGAAVTSLLFSIGKVLIGIYLGRGTITASFGAAGTLVIVIVWVYYCAQIFFLGAEFTKAYAMRHGSKCPDKVAAKVEGYDDSATVEAARRIVGATQARQPKAG